MNGQQSRWRSGWGGVLCVVMALAAVACQGQGKVDLASIPRTFKAKMLISGGGNEVKPTEVAIAKRDQNVRAEINVGGRKQTSIMNAEKKKLYLLSDDMKAYMEAPYDEKMANQNDPFKNLLGQPDTKVEETGTETIDGHSCRKVKVTVTKDGKQETATLWCATDLRNFPVQIESETGGKKTIIKFTEVSLDVPATLFEPPVDYKQMPIPGGGLSGPANKPPARQPEPSN